MTQAEAESSPDMRLHWRAATAIFVVGVVALGIGFGTDGGARPRKMSLSQESPPSRTTSTAPAPPAGVDLATAETPPGESASAASVPSNPEPGPNAADPTTTATTARPARTAPKPTTTTTAPGTVESRGAAALALIDYPWQRTGYSIVFAGANDNLLGLTEPSRKQITIYLRPTQSSSDVTHILGHEIAHAVDFTMTSDAERAEYRRIRGLDDRPWYPTCGICPDYAFPVGDWAETFAYWLLGNGSFNSQLAGKPTPAQLAALKPIFTADAAVAPTTTTTTRPATTPSAPKPTTTASPGGTTTPAYWYWYGGGYRRTAPPDSSGSRGRTRRGSG
jgi:hypothetical protein